MAKTREAINTDYPLAKEAWFVFKVIIVAKFKVIRKNKTKQTNNHLLKNFFILVFSSFHFFWVSSLRGLMWTSEHAVLHRAHLAFSSQVLDPDKERYDFQIQRKLQLEGRRKNAISAQILISLLSYSCNCKIELHLKITPFVHPDLTESPCGKGPWEDFFPLFANVFIMTSLSAQRLCEYIHKINCLSFTHPLVPGPSHPASKASTGFMCCPS